MPFLDSIDSSIRQDGHMVHVYEWGSIITNEEVDGSTRITIQLPVGITIGATVDEGKHMNICVRAGKETAIAVVGGTPTWLVPQGSSIEATEYQSYTLQNPDSNKKEVYIDILYSDIAGAELVISG